MPAGTLLGVLVVDLQAGVEDEQDTRKDVLRLGVRGHRFIRVVGMGARVKFLLRGLRYQGVDEGVADRLVAVLLGLLLGLLAEAAGLDRHRAAEAV